MLHRLGYGLICLALLSGVPAWGGDYVIDTAKAHASVDFRFKHLGISWITGEFKTFEGTFTYDEADITRSGIQVSLDPASIDTNHAERDKHLRGEKYLNVEKYPEAGFKSTRVVAGEGDTFTLYGNLTLHGVTREIAITASRIGEGEDPWGGYRAGFEGFATIDTSEFGFKLPPSNLVELQLYIEGVRK